MRSFILTCILLIASTSQLWSAIGEHQGSDYTVRAMISLWNPELGGDFNYSDPSATFPDDISASDLDLDETNSTLRYEFGINLPLIFDVMVGGFGYSDEASENLSTGVTFGGTDFSGNVDTEFEVDDTYAEIAFRLSLLNASATAGLAIHKQDVVTSISAGGTSEEVDETLYFPVLAARGFFNLPKNLTLEAKIHFLEINIDDYQANYLELHALLSWRPLHHLGVFVGWQIVDMDIDFDEIAGIDDVAFGYDMSGPFIGVLAQF